jgi:pimeloyl-ACP methyl ester carboxylesterase
MLHYSVYRNKNKSRWITFIHGAGGSSSIWFKQIRYFSKYFNLLLIDLRGHGNSKSLVINPFQPKYTFDVVTQDIIEVLDKEKISKSHFVGISLGTILIRKIAEICPERVLTMIMAGAIIKLNFRSRLMMYFGNWTKSFLPYMIIYKMFAWIVMPNSNHKESRILFVREARKLYRKEFLRWYKLTAEIIPLLKIFRKIEVKIPTLYIMGEQDYLFLTPVRKLVSRHSFSKLIVLPECGHVVNVERSELFNKGMLSFIHNLNK